MSLSSVEIEAEKRKTCWKQLVIFFHLYHSTFVAKSSVCDRFGIWVYTAERPFENNYLLWLEMHIVFGFLYLKTKVE